MRLFPALILLQQGTVLIAQTEELDYEPKVHLVQPYQVTGKTNVVLTPWPAYTDDEHILLKSDDLLTVLSPAKDVLDKYLKKVGKKLEDFQERDERVLLQEEESVVEDDYEPRYVEE